VGGRRRDASRLPAPRRAGACVIDGAVRRQHCRVPRTPGEVHPAGVPARRPEPRAP
jgi:hypothetical protein